MDNSTNAPVIPAGTERTVFGTTTFPANNGQAVVQPDANAPQNPATMNQPPAVQPNAPQGITFEQLAVKKGFTSPDQLAEAYAQLESQNTRVSMGLSELAKVREAPAPVPTVQAELDDVVNVQTQEDAVKVVEKLIRKHTQPLEDRIQLQNLFMTHPEAKELAPRMAELIKENPGASWDLVYRAARSERLEADQQRQQEIGRQQAYQAMQTKQSVATEPTKAQPAPRDGRGVEELIRDKTVPFAEVQRIMKERFSQ